MPELDGSLHELTYEIAASVGVPPPELDDSLWRLTWKIAQGIHNIADGGGGASSFADLTGSPDDNAALAAALDAKVDDTDLTTALGAKVNKAGDTMTGQLLNTVAGTALRIAHYGTNIDIYDDDNTTRRWWTAGGRTFARDFSTTDEHASLGGDAAAPGLRLGSGVPVAWSNSAAWYGTNDTFITRGAAGVIGLNTTPVAAISAASTEKFPIYLGGVLKYVMLTA